MESEEAEAPSHADVATTMHNCREGLTQNLACNESGYGFKLPA